MVGAGSAGCAVAHRIASDSGLQVLLLEAGSADTNRMIHIPLGFAFLQKPHINNWGFKTRPEKYLGGRQIDLPRGKVLGGSSSINGMVYIRGQAEDFDRWAELGNEGWSYREVLPYFIRSEHNVNGANSFHGVDGPLWVGNTVDEFPIHQRFIDAAVQAGHPFNEDVNGERQEGVGWFPGNIKNGRRWSSARAFLGANGNLDNLTVVTGAQVDRIRVENRSATGVEVTVNGESRVIRAKREVVLSAGAINSPKLLELSGIGRKQHLEAQGIECVENLPGVGENLQDHWNAYIKQKVSGTKTWYSEARGLSLVRNLLRYVFAKRGFIASPVATIAVFFKASPEATRPDAQIHFSPAASRIGGRGNMVPIDGITVAACNLRPTSRGSVHIRSSETGEPPEIRANYLATKKDRTLAVAAFRKARAVLNQSALKGAVSQEYEPGKQVQSDAAILDYIRDTGEPVHHLAGTCRMGKDSLTSVVDSKLRVFGIDNLRVADASVMPELMSGNTHATCVMIGERCADFVLEGVASRPYGRCSAPPR